MLILIIVDDKNVKRYSEDWRFVEFHLQSSISYEVEIKNIKPIYNEHMINSFDKRIKVISNNCFNYIKLLKIESIICICME